MFKSSPGDNNCVVLRSKMDVLLVTLLFSILVAPAAAQLQLEVSVGSHHKLVECRHGTFILNKKDTLVGRSLDVYGEWSEPEIELLSDFIGEGDVVADVGANVGSFTVPMAKMVGTSGRVVAFEPQRIVSQLLSANLALNELTNVGVYNAGVGNSDSPLDVPEVVYSDEANFGSISLLADWKSRGARTTLVPQVKLDDVFADQCPQLIKIDVVGMELMVLSGAEQTLKNEKCNPVLYVENNCKKGSKELIEFMSRVGYVCHWHVNPYFSERNFRGNEADIFTKNANSINMLCFSGSDPASVQKARKLPDISKIYASKPMLHEYNLSYTGKEGTLSQLGTMDSCER